MFFSGICFSFATAQLLKAPEGGVRRRAGGANEATYNSACSLGDAYDATSQTCHGSIFMDFTDELCDDKTDQDYCIEKGTAEAEGAVTEMTVAKASQMEKLLDTMAKVTGTGWGATISTTATYVAENSASTNSVSFYKAYSGDSFSLEIKNTENLRLSSTAKAKLMNDPEQFVSDYGSHFVSKIIYSNWFIGSVNVDQTDSSSSSSLGVIASISAEDFYDLEAEAETEFTETSADSSLDVSSDVKWSGPGVYACTPDDDDEDKCKGPNAITDIYTQWAADVNSAEDYAQASRIVYSKWTELEDVQALYKDTAFPDVLTQEFPSATTAGYLYLDTIRTKTDQRAVKNLLDNWGCDDVEDEIRAIEAQLAAHQIELENMDIGSMAELEGQIINYEEEGLSWFVGYTGELIGQVNDLILSSETCAGGPTSYITEDFKIYPWGKPRWGPIENNLRFKRDGNAVDDVFLTGFGFTIGTQKIKRVSLIGETLGYQKIEEETNAGKEDHKTAAIGSHYAGNSLDGTANLEVECKEGMYAAGIHIHFSEVMCACATPGGRNEDGNPAGYNQRQCTDGSVDWCDCTHECSSDKAVSKDENLYWKDELCKWFHDEKHCRRRTLEDRLRRRNSEPDYEYGRIASLTLHCVPLPVGTYGLPSTTPTTHGPYTLVNSAGDLVSKDCPTGSAIFGVDWAGVARAENDDDGQTKHDAVFTVAHEVQFKCRDFNDFLA